MTMLSKLEAFIEVARTKNITRAADNLYTSQPSISMKIKALEDQLNTKLFDRSKKVMHLTEEGKVFLHYAESISDLYNEATTIINDFKALNRGTLSVAAGSYYGSYLLPDMLGQFKSKYPGVNIDVKVAFSEVVIQDILVNNYELGFIGETELVEKYPNLVYETILTDELVLIFSKKNPCAQMDSVDIRSLRTETFIKSNRSSALRKKVEKSFQEQNIKFENSIILNNIESIKRAVENNLGFSILPKMAVEREIDLGFLHTAKIENMSLSRELYYVYRNDKVLSRAAKEFLEMSIVHFQG
jgi:DNA-binding transcriptional LysR family regulator